MQINPFAEDEVARKEVLYERLWSEETFAISREVSQVLRDFISYVADDFTGGVALVGAWIAATNDNHPTNQAKPEFPAQGEVPIFLEVVQFMGLDREVVETALAVYAALDPRYHLSNDVPF